MIAKLLQSLIIVKKNNNNKRKQQYCGKLRLCRNSNVVIKRHSTGAQIFRGKLLFVQVNCAFKASSTECSVLMTQLGTYTTMKTAHYVLQWDGKRVPNSKFRSLG